MHESRRRIIEQAAHLFAVHGFAGTTTRQIARATGLNLATIHYHVGTKAELFQAVLEELYREETELLESRLAAVDENAIADRERLVAAFVDLGDALIELMAKRPERPRLYLRRWTDDDDEHRPAEIELSLENHAPLRRLLEGARKAGTVDPGLPVDLFLRSFTWLVYGYFATGPIDWETWFSDPLPPDRIAAFRRFVGHVVRQALLQPWPAKESEGTRRSGRPIEPSAAG